MSGPELIEWLARECNVRKIPPTDSAMIILLRELPDIDVWVNSIRHHGSHWGTTRSEDGQIIDLGNDSPPLVTCPNECAYCGEPCEGEYCSEEHAEHRSLL